MAFDRDEISTIIDRPGSVFCPNRQEGNQVNFIRETQLMTWQDLVGDCANIRPGLPYDPEYPENYRFSGDRCHP